MNKRYIFIIIIFSSLYGYSQLKVEGKVATYPKEEVVSGVIVEHSNPEVVADETNNDGYFSLKFPAKMKSPTVIHVSFPKKLKNCEVVNTWTVNNVSTSSKDSVKIYIADKDSIDWHKQNFYNISKEKIEREYEAKIDSLYKLNANNDSIIAYYQSERDKQLELNRQLSTQIIDLEIELRTLRENPDSLLNSMHQILHERITKIASFVQKNQPDSALYHSKSIDEELKALNKVHGLMIYGIKLRAIAYKMCGDYDNAIKCYMEVDSNLFQHDHEAIFKNNMDLAELEYIHGKYEDAKSHLNKALDNENVTDIYKIRIHNLLGKVEKVQGIANYNENYIKAISRYKSIKKEFSKKIPLVAEKEIAISYTLLASFYDDQNKNQQAEKNFLKALDTYISLNKKEEYDEANQIVMLLRLASLYAKLRKISLVNQCVNRVKILQAMIDLQPDIEATINEEIANYSLVSKRPISEAVESYNKALNYYEKHSQIYNFEIARLYFQIGMAHTYLKEDTISIQFYKLALEKINGATAQNNKYKMLEGFLIASMGKSHMKIGAKKEGENYINKAKEIAKETDNDQLKKYIKQKEFDPWLVTTLGTLGGLLAFTCFFLLTL